MNQTRWWNALEFNQATDYITFFMASKRDCIWIMYSSAWGVKLPRSSPILSRDDSSSLFPGSWGMSSSDNLKIVTGLPKLMLWWLSSLISLFGHSPSSSDSSRFLSNKSLYSALRRVYLEAETKQRSEFYSSIHVNCISMKQGITSCYLNYWHIT